MDWTRPYSYVVEVTRKGDGWSDGAAVAGVTGCTVDWDVTDEAPAVSSCELTLASATPDVPGGWVRVDALVTQDGLTVREGLGCYLLSTESARLASGGWEVTLAGRSVLSPLADMAMPTGAYAPYGADAASWCAALMSEAGMSSPVAAEATAPVPGNVVFGDDATALEAVWDVLGRCSLTMRLAGDGTTTIRRAPEAPSLVVGADGGHGLGDSVEVGDGRLVVTRGWDPSARTGDLVRVVLPAIGVDGTFESVSQGVDLSKGLDVEETLRRTDG